MNTMTVCILADNLNDNTPISNDCGCSCSCGSGSDSQTDETFGSLMSKYFEEVGNLADITVLRYGKDDTKRIIEELNSILVNSNQNLVASEGNIGRIMVEAAPIIAINGKLASIKSYPSTKDLVKALRTGGRIPSGRSCC